MICPTDRGHQQFSTNFAAILHVKVLLKPFTSEVQISPKQRTSWHLFWPLSVSSLCCLVLRAIKYRSLLSQRAQSARVYDTECLLNTRYPKAIALYIEQLGEASINLTQNAYVGQSWPPIFIACNLSGGHFPTPQNPKPLDYS